MDYSSLGLRVGFEIHQQLDTKKLFCNCPSNLKEKEPEIKIKRKLRPTMSEMGEIDKAALEEFKKGKSFEYEVYSDSVCLVEADEEPPYGPQEEAVNASLEIATLLNARPVDEIHFMRKIVIDGSNTAGFQRTSIIALNGYVETEEGTVRLPTFCLEEEAARKISAGDRTTTYRLDRLGIPLIEITSEPDINSPEQARDVALKIGEMLRATGNVKRGIGTIRQDLNISIESGARIEIKGVQDLNTIPKLIEEEVNRQLKLQDVKKELEVKGIRPGDITDGIEDLTGLFKNSKSKIIKGAIKKGGRVQGIRLKGFRGLLGSKYCAASGNNLTKEMEKEKKAGKRLGPELAGYARAASGVKGIFHADELPAYGITMEEVDGVYRALKMEPDDGFVIVAEQKDIARRALNAIINRARMAFEGVPEETRMANPDGSSTYMRPLPGAARMYPETDIPPFKVTQEKLEKIKANLPELYEDKAERFVKDYSLSKEMAKQMVRSRHSKIFEELVEGRGFSPALVANTLLGTIKELKRDGYPVENITQNVLREVFNALEKGKISREAVYQVLGEMAKKPDSSLEEIISSLGITSVDEKEVKEIIKKIIREKRGLVKERGSQAAKPLMGAVMKELKGKADGRLVNRLLQEELEKFLKE